MRLVYILAVVCLSALYDSTNGQDSVASHGSTPLYGAAIDEVTVNSSLKVRKKFNSNRLSRSQRSAEYSPLIELLRVKRQHRGGGRRGGGGRPGGVRPGGGFGPSGFGASAANAQAQGFQSNGPLGSFGASAANTQTQGFQVGPNGIRGSAGLSGSQSYNLPNGHTLNVAYTNGFAVGPNGRPSVSRGNSISYT